MSLEMPVALVGDATESRAETEANAISIRVEAAIAVLFAVVAVVAVAFVAVVTGLI
jgi:hypothetical protein